MAARFVVRQLLSPDKIKHIVLQRAASLGWKPGAMDHEHFFAADKTGFFAGELDGKVISCMSAVKYSKDYAFVGHYIVDEPYRGRGYGLAITQAVVGSLFEGYNLGADSVEDKVHLYASSGFQPHWKVQRKTVNASQALSSLSEVANPKEVTIRPACDIPFHYLLDYDTAVHVYARPSFLKKWTSAPNCFSFAAINNNGTVIGYTVVRTTLRQEDGWKVGPLFADNFQIAKSLCRAVFQQVSKVDPNGMVTIDIPHHNDTALEFSAIETSTFVRIYTKGIPSTLPLTKVFGHTSLELG